MAVALIALGSNLGDRAAMLTRALDLMRAAGNIEIQGVSPWHETKAVGGPANQGPYLNAAAVIETTLAPRSLLAELQRIETQLGRVRSERWGPRTIDLDVLLYESLRLDTPELTIPHPRMHERRFVLAPAVQIAPAMLHPTSGCTVSELLERLNRMPSVVSTIAELQARVRDARRDNKTIGFVPTMGALHEGHLSLIDAARRECSFTVASIFVNPTQFGPQDDYDRYPRMLEADLELLNRQGVDLVFTPAREEMYRPGHATTLSVEGVTARWEGAIRPGHFQGVATIVLKLLHAAQPDVAFFGQKDYQQCVVVRKLIADLYLPVEMRMCPIVRDADGLALSSRNVYLSADERRRALSLSQCLHKAAELFRGAEHNAERVVAAMKSILEHAAVEVDYVAIVDPHTLEPIAEVLPGSVALVAARVGTTRLIDNHIFEWGLAEEAWDEGGEG